MPGHFVPSGAILTRERHMVLIRLFFLMEDTEANESNEHLYVINNISLDRHLAGQQRLKDM